MFDGHGRRSSVDRYRRLSDGGPEGTGSYPPGCHGWQRAMRRTASHEPRSGPWCRSAPMAYAEQLGWNRQHGPMSGLTTYRYALTRAISADCIVPKTWSSAARVNPGGPSRAPGPRSRGRPPRGPVLQADSGSPGSFRGPAASRGCAGSRGGCASSPPRSRAAPDRRSGLGRGPKSIGRTSEPDPRIPAGSRASCGAAGRLRTIGRAPASASAAHDARRTRPLARRALMIRRPERVRIFARKPRRRFARRTLG